MARAAWGERKGESTKSAAAPHNVMRAPAAALVAAAPHTRPTASKKTDLENRSVGAGRRRALRRNTRKEGSKKNVPKEKKASHPRGRSDGRRIEKTNKAHTTQKPGCENPPARPYQGPSRAPAGRARGDGLEATAAPDASGK